MITAAHLHEVVTPRDTPLLFAALHRFGIPRGWNTAHQDAVRAELQELLDRIHETGRLAGIHEVQSRRTGLVVFVWNWDPQSA